MGQNKIAITLFSISLLVLLSLLTILSFGLLQTNWSYSYVVEPIDIVNILTTILVTVFAAWYITKRLSEERYDKELVISDLRSIENCIKKVLDLCDTSDGNTNILTSINQLHILINRFQRTVTSRKINVTKLQNAFWNFYAAATDYDSNDNTANVDLPLVQHLGDDLIIEVRQIIRVVNTK